MYNVPELLFCNSIPHTIAHHSTEHNLYVCISIKLTIFHYSKHFKGLNVIIEKNDTKMLKIVSEVLMSNLMLDRLFLVCLYFALTFLKITEITVVSLTFVPIIVPFINHHEK